MQRGNPSPGPLTRPVKTINTIGGNPPKSLVKSFMKAAENDPALKSAPLYLYCQRLERKFASEKQNSL